MKNKVLLLLVTAFAIVLSSCKKEGDLLPAEIPQAGLDVINAGTDTVNFFQNGTRLNNTSVYFPGGRLGYLSVNAGEQSFQVKKAGTPTVLFDTKYTLGALKPYSLFIAGSTADKIFMMPDIIAGDTTSLKQAQIRFVNASPDASFDVKIGSTFAFTNRGFKSSTAFVGVTAGNSVLTVYAAGSATPLITRTLALVAGKAYTVYTRGKVGGTAPGAFAATLITNL